MTEPGQMLDHQTDALRVVGHNRRPLAAIGGAVDQDNRHAGGHEFFSDAAATANGG